MARLAGRVVFVRHALPGELVRARVTEGGPAARYLRADAVEVLEPSADRVPAPCPSAGPGRCGGCDWQHATPEAQRVLKAQVVREQLHRLAGLDVDVTVEPLPGRATGWAGGPGCSTASTTTAGWATTGTAAMTCWPSRSARSAIRTWPRSVTSSLPWPRVSRVDVAVAPTSGERLVVVTPAPDASRRPAVPDVDASVAVWPAGASGRRGRSG